jgi:hypothetical protein
MAAAPLGMFAATQGTETVAALDGFASFLGDWKKPAGPLKVSITPAKSASMSDLEKIAEPNALWTRFGLKVDYAGTRAGASTGGAAPGGAPKTATAPPADTRAPADGSKTLTGAEAWMTIIGNTVGGKIDGDEVYEYYRKDGSTVLLDGSDITKGRWTLEGERVCFKYPDEDKDCQTVSRTGDDVTFMRKGGKGYRLKVLAGNPKNL